MKYKNIYTCIIMAMLLLACTPSDPFNLHYIDTDNVDNFLVGKWTANNNGTIILNANHTGSFNIDTVETSWHLTLIGNGTWEVDTVNLKLNTVNNVYWKGTLIIYADYRHKIPFTVNDSALFLNIQHDVLHFRQ